MNAHRLFLILKWCAAIGLLVSLTLPFSTCSYDVGGTHQTYVVHASVNDFPFALALLWPIPLLLFQTLRTARSAVVITIEVVCAVLAFIQLELSFVGAAIITLGGAKPAIGLEVAITALGAYFVTAVLQLSFIVGAWIRRRFFTGASGAPMELRPLKR